MTTSRKRRRQLPPAAGPTVTVAVRVSAEEYAQLRVIARQEGYERGGDRPGVSELVRAALVRAYGVELATRRQPRGGPGSRRASVP